MEKSVKGLFPLRISTPSKKAQDKDDEMKQKLYESKKGWNDWKLQLHRGFLW